MNKLVKIQVFLRYCVTSSAKLSREHFCACARLLVKSALRGCLAVVESAKKLPYVSESVLSSYLYEFYIHKTWKKRKLVFNIYGINILPLVAEYKSAGSPMCNILNDESLHKVLSHRAKTAVRFYWQHNAHSRGASDFNIFHVLNTSNCV